MKWTNSYRSFGLKTKRSTGLKTIEHKQLKKPIGVYSVPASALTGLKGSDGCVVATDGTSVKAHVAGSSLGRTLVTIDGKAPASIKADPGQAVCDAR